MTVAIDRVIKHSIINYCMNHVVVEQAELSVAVSADCRVRCGMTPHDGHVWAALKDLHRHGYVEGMFKGEKFGVSRARHNVPPAPKTPSAQEGFGFGEKP